MPKVFPTISLCVFCFPPYCILSKPFSCVSVALELGQVKKANFLQSEVQYEPVQHDHLQNFIQR